MAEREQEPDEPLVPFPCADGGGVADGRAMERWLRPFGVYESDLRLDLRSALRPVVTTRVLERCLRGGAEGAAEGEFLWNLTVGRRILALLTLAVAWDGGCIELELRCPEASCGEALELDVTLEELAGIEAEAGARERVEVTIDGRLHALRRPTGRDQLEWMSRRFTDEREAMLWMARTLVRLEEPREPGEMPGLDETPGAGMDIDALAVIEETMSGFDPLVNFVAFVRCVHCGCEHDHEIDLEEIAFRRLRQAQLRLLGTVHRLARHYHWSEQEIFAVPQWRRDYYLALIEQENR
ncbi:MAG: hypothetical protein JST22_09835 [Bacteroidetes bacterium]|nr:hypothetical protein [Bacteroidota bacterium]